MLQASAALVVDGRFLSLDDGSWWPAEPETVHLANGATQRRSGFADDTLGVRATIVKESYPEGLVERQWLEVTNIGSRPLSIERLDSISLSMNVSGWEVLSFTSEWGAEFEPQKDILNGQALLLENRTGRSSHGRHPWASVANADLRITIAVAWSGNWAIRFEPDGDCYRISAGLSDWEFCKVLAPGQSVVSPAVVMVLSLPDLNAASQYLARWGRDYAYPACVLSETLPVEWNHWWPYEDVDISEEVIRRNADQAAEMGLEVVTLDAGWFGRPGLHWSQLRGDWQVVNQERFPSGLAALGEYIHSKGLKFGIWCEIEAVGPEASLNREHPEFIAQRDGRSLGYVCLGNPEAREWAYSVLERLIVEYGADWIKLDFNLDPGAGCNRTDHGHGAGDGLFEHYRGYYALLERVRRNHPHVVLENCSSGGLRIDLGMLSQTHMTFLSDPDWPVHDLQLFWGATCMLAPSACLHWPFSEWRGNRERVPQQSFDPRDPGLTRQRLDYYTRMSMLNWMGYSLKLPDAPDWVRRRLAEHAHAYQTRVRTFVREADLYRLNAQPLRSGGGDRWQAFEYVMPDGQEALLFVFILPGAAAEHCVKLDGLIEERVYTLESADDGRIWQATGAALMDEGLRFGPWPAESSALIYLS